jgi:hypothetical protein
VGEIKFSWEDILIECLLGTPTSTQSYPILDGILQKVDKASSLWMKDCSHLKDIGPILVVSLMAAKTLSSLQTISSSIQLVGMTSTNPMHCQQIRHRPQLPRVKLALIGELLDGMMDY